MPSNAWVVLSSEQTIAYEKGLPTKRKRGKKDMALRNIVKIDEDKCDGCGQCVNACAEGAIEIIDGKAKLVSEIYCDGLGACLGECPQGAITIEQRQAEAFDEEATKTHLAAKSNSAQDGLSQDAFAHEHEHSHEGFKCPGSMAKVFDRQSKTTSTIDAEIPSQLSHWPVQLKLVSPHASYFKNADLLLAADCVPFAMGDFHSRLLSGRSIAVGCPKLDDSQSYIEKLSEIIKVGLPNSLTVAHIEVPCCFGLTHIAKEAIIRSGMSLTFEDITIDLQGNIIKTETISV